MSTSYGVWCKDCETGYLSDQRSTHLLDALVSARERVFRAVDAINALNNIPVILVRLSCDEMRSYDFEHLISFIAEHHEHTLSVSDEWNDWWHSSGWTGNAD